MRLSHTLPLVIIGAASLLPAEGIITTAAGIGTGGFSGHGGPATAAMLYNPHTFTATVAPRAATAVVQFLDGATLIGTANLSNGAAVFSTSALAAGNHSITASYGGDSNVNASQSGALLYRVKH